MSGYIGNIPVPQATQTRDTFTATAGQTSFATSGYTPSFLDVFMNGSHLVNGTDYTATNGSDVVLTSGAADGDVLEVLSFGTFQSGDFVPTSGGTFTGGVTVPSLTSTGAMTGTNLTLSGGVYLGGTGAANYLDDYEEGTWTPTFSSGTATNIGQATYTKIGRSVTLCVENLRPSDTSSGNTVQIQSLPFAPAINVGGSMGSIMASYRDDDVGISCYVPNSASEIRIYETSVTGSFSALSHAGMFNNSAGSMYLTITYFTT